MLQILQNINTNVFDEGGIFSKGNISNGKHVLIFGVYENSLVHANNKRIIFT